MQRSVDVIEGFEQANAALHPVRMRLLESFREPHSCAEVARILDLPRQRVGHHVRLLQDRGLLQAVGERRNGNFVEQLLQTSARAYVVAPQTFGSLAPDPATVRDRFSSEYLTATAAQTLRDISELRRLATLAGKRVPTLTLETEVRFASADDQAAFATELAELVGELVGRYHQEDAPGGRRFRFLTSGYPKLASPPPSATGGGGDEGETVV